MPPRKQSTGPTERQMKQIERLIQKAEARHDAEMWLRENKAMFTPNGFDEKADAELMRQRGALRRLCEDISKLPPPSGFIHDHADYFNQLHSIAIVAAAAHQWLGGFLEHLAEGDDHAAP